MRKALGNPLASGDGNARGDLAGVALYFKFFSVFLQAVCRN
jgi:hypothetical protein